MRTPKQAHKAAERGEYGDGLGLNLPEQRATAQPADWQKVAIRLKAELDKSKAHAKRLAEALREIGKEIEARRSYKPDRIFKGCEWIVKENARIAREALAQWNEVQP
jgi:hypothetical protein